MFYLSLKDKIEKNNAKSIIKELNVKGKIYDESKEEDDSLENIKKSKIIITDFNIENIKDYLAMKKKVIVYKKNNIRAKEEDQQLFYNKNVYTYNRKTELQEILNYLVRKSKIKKTVIKLLFSIILVALLIGTTIMILPKTNKKVTPKKQTNKIEEKIVEKTGYESENIVFYGDSITDFYNLENFYDEEIPVVNSGTSGFQTPDLLRLLKERVYIYNPTKVFIMIGTNDIAFTDITNEELVNNIKKICNLIKKNRPKAKIYVESIYPVNKRTDNDKVQLGMVNIRENSRITEINTLIKKMCKENNIEYINMYDELLDEQGDLKLDYTIDGLHMSDAGYEVITKKLMKYIKPTTKTKE